MFSSDETFSIALDTIVNHNCDGLCTEQFCGQPETHFMKIEIYGMTFCVALCKRHYDLLEDKIFHEQGWQNELAGNIPPED